MFGNNNYSLVCTGLGKTISKEFGTRDRANALMYKLIGKNNLTMIEIYDDHHDKTYKCTKGVTFFINRI